MKPIVSVIMPVYNGEEFLSTTISSILQQDLKELEFIIVNDGSTDKSAGIIKGFDDKRIRYMDNLVNRGLIYSLNAAIEISKGEYIARIDADDVAEPSRLQKQLNFLEEHREFALCGTFYRIIDKAGAVVESVELPRTDKDIRTYLLFGNCFCHSSIMIRRSVLQKFGYSVDYQLCEDYDLWFRVMLHHKVVNLPSFDTLYRVHGENISTRKREEMLSCVKQIHGRALRSIGYPFTEKELILHNALLGFDHIRCFQFDRAEIYLWLDGLSSYLMKQQGINGRLALKVLIRRWITICYNARHYRLLIKNPLAREYSLLYLTCAVEKLIDKWLNRNRGLDL